MVRHFEKAVSSEGVNSSAGKKLTDYLERNGLSQTPRVSDHAKDRFLERFQGMPKKRIAYHIKRLISNSELLEDNGANGEQRWIDREYGLILVTKHGQRRGVPRLMVVTCYHRKGVYVPKDDHAGR